MITHLLLPGVALTAGFSHPAYEQYLRSWREQAIMDADNGHAAASICHQATLIDLVLDGRPVHDWLSVMEDLLTDVEGRPLAYSRAFGARLYKFDCQFLQSTIHAIHTRWWIETLAHPYTIDHGKFAALILCKKESDGLFVDVDVSPTTLRHRMKTELSMSAVMSVEILSKAKILNDNLRFYLATSLCDLNKIPALGYMTCEQFRLAALRILGHEEQFPVGIYEHIKACEVGLNVGWNDFSMASKVDAYMGTAKRTNRDKPVHSPLVACHVAALLGKVDDQDQRQTVVSRLTHYSRSLAGKPLDIPAFQMRDVPIPFGVDLTPIEAICASYLIANYHGGGCGDPV